jgi:hypothetical protein
MEITMTIRHHRALLVAVAFAAAAAIGCAGMQVHVSLEPGNRLLQYRTYSWADDGARATGDPRLDSNPFFERRVMEAAERELAARGYERSASGSSDVILHYHANVSQRFDIGNVDRGPTPCVDCEPPSLFDTGTLMLDFVDARTNRLVWRAWAESSIDSLIDNQQELEKHVDDVVAHLVATLPRHS